MVVDTEPVELTRVPEGSASSRGNGSISIVVAEAPALQRQRSLDEVKAERDRLEAELRAGRAREDELAALIQAGERKRAESHAAQPAAGLQRQQTVGDPALLTRKQRRAVERIFALIDLDGSGTVSKAEAVEFGRVFVRDVVDAEEGVEQMFQEVDADGDGQLSLDEWTAFFAKIIPADMKDKDVNRFFGHMAQTVKLSRQPVKWTPPVRRCFLALLCVQLVMCAAILGVTATLRTNWDRLNDAAGQSRPVTELRFAFGAIGIASCLLGLFAGAKNNPRLLLAFSGLSMSVFVLNLASLAVDQWLVSEGAVRCFDVCVAMGLPSADCDCTVKTSFKTTGAFSAVIVFVSAFPALIAVFFSTKCGSNRYLNQWAKMSSRLTGLGAATLADAFWFQPAAPDREDSKSELDRDDVAVGPV